MPKMHLTKNAVEKLAATDGRAAFYRDDKLPAFGVRVSGPAKSFIVEKRVNGRNVRVTLGRYPQMTPELARNRAQSVLGEMALGVAKLHSERHAKRPL